MCWYKLNPEITGVEIIVGIVLYLCNKRLKGISEARATVILTIVNPLVWHVISPILFVGTR